MGLIALAICGVALVWAVWPREREPVYQGKGLSRWLLSEGHRGVNRDDNAGQQAAIVAIGTNALPFLVRWLQYERQPWRVRIFNTPLDLEWRDRRSALAGASVTGFEILGPRATAAIPELVQVMKATKVNVALRGLISIEATGPAAFPALLDVLTNRQAYCPDRVFSLLGTLTHMGTNAEPIIPGLIECLQKGEPRAAGTAALLLGQMAIRADVVVPALARCLGDSDEQERYWAVYALGRFHESGRSVVSALVPALSDTALVVRNEATNLLQRIAPEVLEELKGR